ncbi:MAG: DUF1349 domain-containing protein, partial [Melioribacteraceae bacterium]|nr:DUF1349 domain-containing protein [Melioribacteraceae bacterium]
MKKLLKIVLIVAGIIIFPQISNAQVTHFVSPSGGNVSPYTNWGDAANNIQDAINVSNPSDLVLVDDGTYLLSTNISIIIGITVESVNGYSSTIIDGNNATRCFFIDHTDALLDGFTIQNGYNPGGFGGGVNIDDGGSIVNCYITGNQARDGGGVALDDDGLIYNCIITGNSADNNSSNGYGGGIRLLNGGTARNCLIYDNHSENYGGGVNIWNAGLVQNCTITGNDAPNGGGIRARSNSTIENCIIYFNTSSGSNYNWQISGSGQTFSYSCSTPALPSGTGNTTDDPLFENAGANDYHLSASSTLINAGLNDAWMTGVFDLDGNERIFDGTVDIGAYEFKTVTPISDDFFPETTANSFWRLYDPVGDADLLLTGTNAKLSVPAGVEHNLWTSNSDAPRLLQSAPDADFTIEVKFESTPTTQYQLQGIIVQETNDKFIRFGTYSSGSPNLFCVVIDGTTLIQTPSVPAISITQHFLRVERSGDTWTYSYSDDGTSWNVAATFTQAFAVTEVGFYAGNAGGNPAFTANADYFMNLADPITDTDSQPLSPPVIDVWYGDNQNFGQLGNPQSWINILGRVTDDISVASLSYSLNGSPSNSL